MKKTKQCRADEEETEMCVKQVERVSSSNSHPPHVFQLKPRFVQSWDLTASCLLYANVTAAATANCQQAECSKQKKNKLGNTQKDTHEKNT